MKSNSTPVPGDLVWFNSSGSRETGLIIREGVYPSANNDKRSHYVLIVWHELPNPGPRPQAYEILSLCYNDDIMVKTWDEPESSGWYRTKTDAGCDVFKIISNADYS